MADALFDEVVAATRLSPLLAPFTVRRLLIRMGVVPPEAVTVEELQAALPDFREGLAVYLEEDQLDAVLRDLEALARRPAA